MIRPQRILVINPNSSLAVTAAIDEGLAPLRMSGGPEIAVARLESGPLGISTQADIDSVILPIADWVRRDDADGFVLACFSDPGLFSAREAAGGRPVMGIAEWGLLRALTLGERFGVIALSPASVRRQQRYIRQMGLHDRYAGSVPVHASAEETAGVGIRERLAEAGRQLAAERGADVIVLGCAGMAVHRRALAEAIDLPVVEPTREAVVAAIGAVRLADA